ncbi:MAG: galactokinase family protein [Gemmatimonas sp.]
MSDAVFPPLGESVVQATYERAGFSDVVAERYRKLERDAGRALDEAGVTGVGRRTWIVPGRIEVLGKHVDYAGGRSLLCTVERGIVLIAAPRTDRKVVLRDARRREAMVVSLDPSPFPSSQAPLPWAVYPRTVVRRLQHNFGERVVGADIALASNLPPAAGVSSSSALVVGLTLGISALSDLASDSRWHEALVPRTALAGYCGAMENGLDFGTLAGERGVGTLGGAQDQTAILCCAPGKLDVFGWTPVLHEREVSWPTDHVFVIAVSGIVASKTGAARDRYNRVARTVHHLVHAWNAQGGSARTLRDVLTQSAAGDPSSELPSDLVRVAHESANDEFSAAQLEARLHQFHTETWHHVPAAAEALARQDLDMFGRVVAASQRGAEVALENQIPETIHMVSIARELGAVAASAFGAGFGGSVWAMIPEVDAERFASRWRDRYVKAFPQVANRVQVFATKPSAPAFELI